jgi:hypothetical protein
MKKYGIIAFFISILSLGVSAQLNLPRESQKQTIVQNIGDATVSIVYHRPNVKGRTIFGDLEPYGKVWRSGANENTVFEVTRDVTIDGKPLPAGKYGLHSIPDKAGWIVIFSKDNDKWGSFSYNEANDALRVTVRPMKIPVQESLSYSFDDVTAHSAKVALRWEKVAIPFTVDVGDVTGRMMAQIHDAVKNRKTDDLRPLNAGANYVVIFKVKESYDEALGWIDTVVAARETFGNLTLKARLLAEMGRKQDAIALGEKALAMGKAATPPAFTRDLERLLAEWRGGK